MQQIYIWCKSCLGWEERTETQFSLQPISFDLLSSHVNEKSSFAAPMFIAASYEEQNTVVWTHSWGSTAILLHQMLSAPKPGTHKVWEKTWIQQTPSSQWALRLQFTNSAGICRSFLSSHLPPTPPQLLLQYHYLVYSTLQIVLNYNFHNISSLSDNTSIRQFTVNLMFYKGLTKKKSQEDKERQEGENNNLSAVPMNKLWSSHGLTNLELCRVVAWRRWKAMGEQQRVI